MPSFNFRNIFLGPSQPVDQPEYQYPHGGFSDNHRALVPSQTSRVLQKSGRPPVNQWANQTGPVSRGATVVDYDDHSDSSSLLTEGVLVQNAVEIPAVHRQHSGEYFDDSHLHNDDDHFVPVRPRSQTRSSSESTSSTPSSERSMDDRDDELPPQIIPEYSRPYSEYRSEHSTGTRHGQSHEAPTQGSSRSRRHRRTKHRSSRSASSQAPVILLFENGRGGFNNMWYIMPGEAPVIFEDADGNEITRVGDFSRATSTSTKPPIILDQFGSPRHHANVPSSQIRNADTERYKRHGSSEYSQHARGHSRHSNSGGSSVSSTPSVTFINLQSNTTPQLNRVEPVRTSYSTSENVIYVDSSGRRSTATSSRTSSRSNSSVNGEEMAYVPQNQTRPVYS